MKYCFGVDIRTTVKLGLFSEAGAVEEMGDRDKN